MKKVNNQNRQNHHKIFLQFSQKIHTLLIAGNDTENSEITVFLEIWYFLATLVSLTRYFVSLNEIIQIPSYTLSFGITDVCSQIFRGYAGMQRGFRMVQLLLLSGVFSLCASVQQGWKYDNNLKYMHRIIRLVVTVRQLMQRYYGFPRSVCGLVVGMTVLYLC